jgi:hypothetical protein
MARASIEQQYKGYRLSGDADPVSNHAPNWYAIRRVWLDRSDNSTIMADCFNDQLLTYEDEDTAKCVGLWLAEISVDNFLTPIEYYLTPMNTAWAVTILRRAAEECKEREIRRSKLYGALDFLEKNIDAPVLVRQYRRALQGDRPDEWQKEELRQILMAAVLGIQQSASVCSILL